MKYNNIQDYYIKLYPMYQVEYVEGLAQWQSVGFDSRRLGVRFSDSSHFVRITEFL